jgi:hypothetical protein
MSVNFLKLHEMQTAMNSLAVEEAEKSGKKITAGIRTVADAVGVDYATMKGFVFGTIKNPSERTVDRVRLFLRDGESQTPPPQEPRAVKSTALNNDDIAILLDLLSMSAMEIRDDYLRMEDENDEAVNWADATYRTLYAQEGRLKRLSKKLESQASCKFDFDVELQSVVPVESD